jgi:hypothetical protein
MYIADIPMPRSIVSEEELKKFDLGQISRHELSAESVAKKFETPISRGWTNQDGFAQTPQEWSAVGEISPPLSEWLLSAALGACCVLLNSHLKAIWEHHPPHKYIYNSACCQWFS